MSVPGITKGDKGPYSPSYPSEQLELEDSITEFQEHRKKNKHKLFLAKENTIIGVLEEEILERQAIKESLEKQDKEREERELGSSKRAIPGFWIFGSGQRHELPESFKNPDQCTLFIFKILTMMVINSLLRGIILSLILLYKPFHDGLYKAKVYEYPFIFATLIYVIILLLGQSNAFNNFIRKHHFHGILFIFSEIILGLALCFFAILIEYGTIQWYSTLDLFNDYDELNKNSRHHWTQVKLTPPIFLVLADFQIAINIIGALLLQSFTPIHIGTHELYRILIWLTLFTYAMTYLIILTSSYGVLPIWDGLQAVVGCLIGLAKSWIFAYKVVSLMAGKLARMDSMSWNDVFYGAYMTF